MSPWQRLRRWLRPSTCTCGGTLRFTGIEQGWGAGTDEWTCETCGRKED